MINCLAIEVNEGLVFASDSCTNAGVDHISSYSKMYAFNSCDDRTFVLLSSGNRATTQGVINHIRRDRYEQDASKGIKTFDYVFDVAEYIGKLSRRVQGRDCSSPQQQTVNLEASFILGGQIGNQQHEIFLIYPEGNYIAVSPTKPYLQIGETKYGKPILDRIITPDTKLEDAARCALVSLDSTMRSNLSVGPPFELAIYCKDELNLNRHLTLNIDSPLYQATTQGWGDGIKTAFKQLPKFVWE